MSLQKVAYRIDEWGHAVGLGRSKIYQLIAEGRIEVVKCGARTLVTTLPTDFLESLRTEARAA